MKFDEIYSKYFNDVYLYIRRLSGNEHIAEEVTSDTFFKAMRSIENFRGDCDIRVWLCQIAKNSYYSYIKKNKKIQSIDEENFQDFADPNASVDELIERKNEAEQVQKILHTLPDIYKEVFMWRVFAELDFKQIGGIFNKTDNWACVTYHRARKMIRTKLEGLYNEK